MSDDYFCEAGYRRILERALELGYRTSTFRSFEAATSQPVLLLRHDLDHSVRCALPIARREASLGVHSTYFVQVACTFYNVLSSESRGVLRELTDLGHEVGLHYDAGRYVGANAASLAFDVKLVSELAGQPCVSGSQHMPIAAGPMTTHHDLVNEAYESRFTAAPMQYISDSLLAWRQARPHDLLATRASFQLLTHPENWANTRPHVSMEAMLESALEKEIAALQQNSADTAAFYRYLLTNRAALDEQFLERRRQQSAP